jgi:hypothetical protein
MTLAVSRMISSEGRKRELCSSGSTALPDPDPTKAITLGMT